MYVTFVFNIQCSEILHLRLGKNFSGSKLRINVYETFFKCLIYLSQYYLLRKHSYDYRLCYIVAYSAQNVYIIDLYLCAFKTLVQSIQITLINSINLPSVLRFILPLQLLLILVLLTICLKTLRILFNNLYVPEWMNDFKTWDRFIIRTVMATLKLASYGSMSGTIQSSQRLGSERYNLQYLTSLISVLFITWS